MELDQFLQHMVENVEAAESLACSIELKLFGADPIPLNKTYRRRMEVDRQAPDPA